jgi:hypothetical protein
MRDVNETSAAPSGREVSRTAEYIARVQREDGLIPWTAGDTADPWDHIEGAMGLSVAGYYEAARSAYEWLRSEQLPDGSWWETYNTEVDGSRYKETHRTTYVATGVWHHYLVTGDRSFLERMWPTVEHALEFAVRYQEPTGEIFWAVDGDGDPDRDALLSSCCSTHKSLSCGIAIARRLDRPHEEWMQARDSLRSAIVDGTGQFDRTWESKRRYAMNWFYPVLSGLITVEAARERLDDRMDEFLVPGLGCRCVTDEPWVAVAETSELVLALVASDRRSQATSVFDWLSRWQADDGGFWTGYQFEDEEIWPEEKPTWTAGAVLLAADALYGLTDANTVFIDQVAPD